MFGASSHFICSITASSLVVAVVIMILCLLVHCFLARLFSTVKAAQ